MRKIVVFGSLVLAVAVAAALLLPALAKSRPLPRIVHEIDWNEHGLDPSLPNFRPEALILAGTVVTEPEGGMSPQPGQTNNFEITMRGYDYYHRIEWRDGRAWRWHITLVAGTFKAEEGRFRKTAGIGGGGMGGSFSSKDWFTVARRLWEGTNLIGATSEALYEPVGLDGFVEQFKNLERRGPFNIPRTILYKGWPDGRTRTYFVKKIEFTSEPTAGWFINERDRLFPAAAEKEKEFNRGITNFVRIH